MPTRILIADDNQAARGRLSELLTDHHGWEVCAVAENGREAVEKAGDLKPSLVILDLAMPVMDGLSAAREIARILPSVPIVLFTLHNFPAIELEAKKAGVRNVVSKPDVDTLLSTVENLLKNDGHEPPSIMAAAASINALASRSVPKTSPEGTETTTPRRKRKP